MDELSEADEYEAGRDAEAARNWAELVSRRRHWSGAHVHLINFLRALYRVCAPPFDEPFVPGGSLVFNGAHIRICKDDGDLYGKLLGASGLVRRKRISSHESLAQQFEIAIPHLGCVLVGVGPYWPALSAVPPAAGLAGFPPTRTNTLHAPTPRLRAPWRQGARDDALAGWGQNGAGRDHTWLQCERHSGAGGPVSLLLHFLDFLQHKASHKQVGPLGLSPYSEKTSEALRVRSLPPFD